MERSTITQANGSYVMYTENELRERVHRFFSSASVPIVPTGECPDYWVPPSPEQIEYYSKKIAEQFNGHDEDDDTNEKNWLKSPLPRLGGRCPEDLITGDEQDRQFLADLLESIEQGIFT